MTEFDISRKEVDETYKNIVAIADDLVAKSARSIDDLVKEIKRNLVNLTNQEISNYMLQLSIEAYYFGQKKEHATLKQEIAEAAVKEGLAKSYNTTEGTVAFRQNQAMLDISEKQAVKLLYDVTAGLMKTKLDEIHRLINVLNGALINRNAEAKLNNSNVVSSIDNTPQAQRNISSDVF